MSIFNWFKQKSAPPLSTSLPSDGLTVPSAFAPTGKLAEPGPSIKVKRQDRREQLYKVVRDVLLRAEVLAASYKFKVLSLDTHGRQFMIMVDMLDSQALHPDKFPEIERLIVSAAALRHDLMVKSVYWRVSGQTVVAPAAPEVVPKPQVQKAQNSPDTLAKPASRAFEPIGADEVLAFKNAIRSPVAQSAQAIAGEVVTSGPRHLAPPSGFEDTLILDSEEPVSPLSSTQYGDV